MANTLKIKTIRTGAEPSATAFSEAELGVKQVAFSGSVAASGKLYYGEDVAGDGTTVSRAFGIGIKGSSGSQRGVPIGGNLIIAAGSGISTTATVSGDVATVTITASGDDYSSWTIAADDDSSTVSSGQTVTMAGTAPISTVNTSRSIAFSIDNDGITDTHLAYNTGQHLTTTSAPTFATVDTGQGANELYDMNQNVQTTDAVTFATVNTGQGANELYDMNQNVQTTDAVTFSTVNTGQGANELYDMNQNVQTTDDVTFANLELSSSDDDEPLLTLTGSDTSDEGPVFEFIRTGTSANNDFIGTHNYYHKNASGSSRVFVRTDAQVISRTTGGETGKYRIRVSADGQTSRYAFTATGDSGDSDVVDVEIAESTKSTTAIAGIVTLGAVAASTDATWGMLMTDTAGSGEIKYRTPAQVKSDIGATGEANEDTDLTKTVSGSGFSINSSTGNNVDLSIADTSNWGLMSDEMFDHLDGIETSATGDQSAGEILTLVENGIDSIHYVDDSIDADHLANSINTDIATGVTASTTAGNALPKAGGAMTGAITTNSTFDGVDVAAASVLASAALPKGGGAMTGAITTNSTFDGVDVAAASVLASAALPKGGGAMTGAITTNSTFDGVDVAAASVLASAALPKGGGTMSGAIAMGSNNITGGGTAAFTTLDTGQGANELYDMNQNVKTNSAVTFATLEITGTAGSIDTEGSIYLTGDEKVVRWYEGSNYISFAAPSTVSEDTDYLWPAADGTDGYQLTTDGSGNLSWAASGGANYYITGLALSGGTVTATVSGASNPTVDLTGLYTAGDGLTLNTRDFDIDAAQTTITSIINSSFTDIGTAADQEYIKFDTANEINTMINNTERLSVTASGANVTGTFSSSGAISGSNLSGTNTGDANFYITGLALSSGTVTATVSGASNPTVDLTGLYTAGDGLTLNTRDFDLDAALTTVTSVVNTGLEIGRDADNRIKFGTDNQIIFEVSGGDNVIMKASGEIEATKFDGALEGNADTATLAATATALASARTFRTNLASTSTASFDGTGNVTPGVTGTLAVGSGGTGATSLSNLITLTTHTSGNYVGTITGGDGITSSAATSGEGTTHSLSAADVLYNTAGLGAPDNLGTLTNDSASGDKLLIYDISGTPAWKQVTAANLFTNHGGGGGGSGTINSGSTNEVAHYTGSTTVDGHSGFTYDPSGQNVAIGNHLTAASATLSGTLEIDVGSGDPMIIFDTQGADKFTMGVDDSDSDKFKINSGSTLATTSDFMMDSSGNVTIAGDLTISGNDLYMASNTSGYILVADGTSFDTVAVSGDVTISSGGSVTIGVDKVDIPMLSASGTASSSTFLRGDNSWVTPTDTNTTYTPGTALDLSGTTFNVDLTEIMANGGATADRILTSDGDGTLSDEDALTFHDGTTMLIVGKSGTSGNLRVYEGASTRDGFDGSFTTPQLMIADLQSGIVSVLGEATISVYSGIIYDIA